MFEYDVAISFAGEQRTEAEAIAACLTTEGIKVFYDDYERATLWGKNLYEHLAEVYQNKARYCLMLVSAAYANKVWPTHERRSAQARALTEKSEYILPIRFDDTEIPGLPSTVGYQRFQDHGVQGISALLLEKLHDSPNVGSAQTEATQVTTTRAVTPEPPEYFTQRKTLPDTETLTKIYAKPRWRIGIYPTEFRKARFRDLDHCLQFMRASSVRIEGWFPYPWVAKNGSQSGNEWIGGEVEQSEPGRIQRLERWVLFRSAQFAHHRALDEIPQLGGRVHVLEILDTTTAALEFLSRMEEQKLLSPEAVITFDMHGIEGRLLTWPTNVFRDSDFVGEDVWCQESEFRVERQAGPTEFQTRKRELALQVALEIYSKFGWMNPPEARLAAEQQKRFGA
jgi:hypothetical protein